MIPISVYAAKVYDGVMLYARAIRRVLNAGGDPKDTTQIVDTMLNSSFLSKKLFSLIGRYIVSTEWIM